MSFLLTIKQLQIFSFHFHKMTFFIAKEKIHNRIHIINFFYVHIHPCNTFQKTDSANLTSWRKKNMKYRAVYVCGFLINHAFIFRNISLCLSTFISYNQPTNDTKCYKSNFIEILKHYDFISHKSFQNIVSALSFARWKNKKKKEKNFFKTF